MPVHHLRLSIAAPSDAREPMRASMSNDMQNGALHAQQLCNTVEPRKQHQQDEVMHELLTTVDAVHAQLNATMATSAWNVSESQDLKPPHGYQHELLDYPQELLVSSARPKLLLRPKSNEIDSSATVSCWQLERRRQATYRVLFGRPLLSQTLSPAVTTHTSAASSQQIASPLAQQPIKAASAKPPLTAKASRKRKPPKPRAQTPKRLRAAQAKQEQQLQLTIKDELCAVKEEKLSLVDQILFGDNSYELALGASEVDFRTTDWRSLDSDAKSQLEAEVEVNCLGLAGTELLLEELESDLQFSSILSLDYLKGLGDSQEKERQEATPGKSFSPLDASLLDDLLSCEDDSLDFAL